MFVDVVTSRRQQLSIIFTSQPQLFDVSPARYATISEYIRNYVRDRNYGENDGASGLTLLRLCQEEFYDERLRQDPALMKKAKDEIVATIRRMRLAGVLPFVRNNRIFFYWLAREEESEEDLSTIEAEQRNKQAEEVETSLLEEEPEMDESELDREFVY